MAGATATTERPRQGPTRPVPGAATDDTRRVSPAVASPLIHSLLLDVLGCVFWLKTSHTLTCMARAARNFYQDRAAYDRPTERPNRRTSRPKVATAFPSLASQPPNVLRPTSRHL